MRCSETCIEMNKEATAFSPSLTQADEEDRSEQITYVALQGAAFWVTRLKDRATCTWTAPSSTGSIDAKHGKMCFFSLHRRTSLTFQELADSEVEAMGKSLFWEK